MVKGLVKQLLLTRLPQTIFIENKPLLKGFKLCRYDNGKTGDDNTRTTGDITSCLPIVGFYKSTFGLEFDAGYSAG